MDTRKYATLALALLTSVGGLFSSPLNAADYTFAEARFLFDAEVNNFDGDGFRFGGSFRLTNDFYAFGSYDDVDLDDVNVDISLLKLGVGYIHPLDSAWDANFALAYVNADSVANNGTKNSDNGIELTAGVRGMIKPEIEARAELNYLDLDDSDTYLTVAADYYFTSNVSAGIEIDMGADYETLSIGAKYYFK